jgi:spermidine synthase
MYDFAAQEYFGVCAGKNFNIITENADTYFARYLNTSTNIPMLSFDVIIIDAAVENRMPSELETLQFLRSLRSSLTPGGLVLVRALALGMESQTLFQRFVTVFSSAYQWDMLVMGSTLLIGSDKQFHVKHRELVQRIQSAVQKRQMHPSLLSAVMTSGENMFQDCQQELQNAKEEALFVSSMDAGTEPQEIVKMLNSEKFWS